jgi:hypothetical protein
MHSLETQRRPRCRDLLLPLLLTLLLAVSGCTARPGISADEAPHHPVTLRVPQQFPTIQRAVDVARSGDLVLVSSGVYRESVTISTPRVTLRGVSRSGTVIDGQFQRSNGITVTGAGSVVEDLTVRGELANGVLFTGVTDADLQTRGAGGEAYDPLDTVKFPPLQGFRASYVTSYDNALYGIYAFDASQGVIEHSYASGQADSGIYVGQCRPCQTLVHDDTVEHNAVGVEITNASQGLTVLGNHISHNRVGLTVDSNNLEALGPQHEALIVGNVISDNNDAQSPEQADGGFGIGVGVGGGTRDLFERNLVTGNQAVGIVLSDIQGYPVGGVTVRDNRVAGNGADLVLATVGTRGNCFVDNGEATTSPAHLASLARCGAANQPLAAPGTVPAVQAPPGVSFEQLPAPPAQPQMPQAATASARPAVGLPGRVETDGYPLPTG